MKRTAEIEIGRPTQTTGLSKLAGNDVRIMGVDGAGEMLKCICQSPQVVGHWKRDTHSDTGQGWVGLLMNISQFNYGA